MHHLLPLKLKLWLVIGLVFITSAIFSALDLHPLGIGMLVSVVDSLILFGLMNSWPQCAWLLNTCGWSPLGLLDIHGEWSGKLSSQHNKAQNKEGDAPLKIIQSWKDIVFILKTEQMEGVSICSMPSYNPSTRILTIRYFYQTEPKADYTLTNPPQKHGSAIATVSLDDPETMNIRYTNERGLGGNIVLNRE